MSTATAAEQAPRPWDRNASEGDKHWRCFLRYRNTGSMNGDTPGRRIKREIAQLEGVDYQEMCKWSQEHDWRQRATLYDMHLDHLAQDLNEKNIIAMHRRHARQGRLLQTFASTEAGKLAAKAKEREFDAVDDAKPADVARIMETGIKLERLSSGEATDHTQTSGTIDPSKLSLEELKLFKSLIQKAST